MALVDEQIGIYYASDRRRASLINARKGTIDAPCVHAHMPKLGGLAAWSFGRTRDLMARGGGCKLRLNDASTRGGMINRLLLLGYRSMFHMCMETVRHNNVSKAR